MKQISSFNLKTQIPPVSANPKRVKVEGLIRQFLDLCEALFGAPSTYEPVTPKNILVYFGVAFFAGLLLLLRRIDAIANPQFRVEDGTLLFKDSLFSGFWEHLTNLSNYANFPYLIPKLGARAALPFGLANAPLVYNIISVSIAALTMAWFSLPYFRHIVRNDYLRITFCLLMVALPTETEEVVTVLVGVGLYLANWLFLTSIMPLPRSRRGLILLGLAFLVTIFSIPYAILVTPLWMVRVLRGLLNHDRQELYFGIYALSLLASLLLITGNLGATKQAGSFNFVALINAIVTRAISEAVVGSKLLYNLREQAGGQIIYLITAGVLVLILGLSGRIRFRNLPVLMICGYGILSSVAILLLGRNEWDQFASDLNSPYLFIAPRYFMLGNLLVYLTFFSLLDQLQAGRFRLVTGAIILVVIGLAITPTFILAPFEDLNWKSYAQQISTKLATPDNQLLLVPINPGGRWGWFIPVGSPNYAPEVRIDPQLEAGELIGNDEFSQTFVSKCANLTGLDVYLSNYNRTNIHPINFLLKDLETGQVVVEREIGGPQVVDNAWRTYYFFPLENSAGHRYMFTLLSPLSTPGNAITIWRSQGDAYPDGEAFVKGQLMKADFVFRYICQ